jgi:hypothetical protein
MLKTRSLREEWRGAAMIMGRTEERKGTAEERQNKAKSVTKFNAAARCASTAWRHGCVAYALQAVA